MALTQIRFEELQTRRDGLLEDLEVAEAAEVAKNAAIYNEPWPGENGRTLFNLHEMHVNVGMGPSNPASTEYRKQKRILEGLRSDIVNINEEIANVDEILASYDAAAATAISNGFGGAEADEMASQAATDFVAGQEAAAKKAQLMEYGKYALILFFLVLVAIGFFKGFKAFSK